MTVLIVAHNSRSFFKELISKTCDVTVGVSATHCYSYRTFLIGCKHSLFHTRVNYSITQGSYDEQKGTNPDNVA